jgi:hypothetical protein
MTSISTSTSTSLSISQNENYEKNTLGTYYSKLQVLHTYITQSSNLSAHELANALNIQEAKCVYSPETGFAHLSTLIYDVAASVLENKETRKNILQDKDPKNFLISSFALELLRQTDPSDKRKKVVNLSPESFNFYSTCLNDLLKKDEVNALILKTIGSLSVKQNLTQPSELIVETIDKKDENTTEPEHYDRSKGYLRIEKKKRAKKVKSDKTPKQNPPRKTIEKK